MNKRGSALINVLIVVSVLTILGLALFQVVRADTRFAYFNRDTTQAFQLAEGGIDYGLEMLIQGAPLGTPMIVDLDEGTLEVLIVDGIFPDQFIITSTGSTADTSRTVKVTVEFYNPGPEAFEYSLFIGGGTPPGEENEDEKTILDLYRFDIHGSVYIASDIVILDRVRFIGDSVDTKVHFQSESVKIANSSKYSNVTLSCRGEPNPTALTVPNGWFFERVNNPMPFPQVDIANFGTEEYEDSFYSWSYADDEWSEATGEIDYGALKAMNYFDNDVTIVVRDALPPWGTITIAGLGNICFDTKNQTTHHDPVLIVMAEGDITGIGRLASNKEVPLYLYSKGSIETEQNLTFYSVMAQYEAFKVNQNQTIKAPDPNHLPNEILKEWPQPRSMRIVKWEN